MRMTTRMMLLDRDRERERRRERYPEYIPQGYAQEHADSTGPRHRDTDRMHGGRPWSGHSESTDIRPLDVETAEEWAADMDNEDGTHGPHWSMDQVRQLMAQRGITCPLPDFFAVLNAVYSDYVKVAKKHGVGGNMDYYVDMALAWLDDKDAVEDKAAAYYRYIVRH